MANDPTIYIASKTDHADRWRKLRLVLPIISTWIDEAGKGESASLPDLWLRCISEASAADVTIVFAYPEEHLKGALVEMGAALASGKPVYIVGDNPAFRTMQHHPLVRRSGPTVGDAYRAFLAELQP